MDFYEVVDRRRTVREFEPKLIEEKKIFRVLNAGLKAPSHNHLREWEFILVKDFEIRRKVVEEGAGAENVVDMKQLDRDLAGLSNPLQREMYLKAIPVQHKMLMNSPELLVVCFKMRKPLKDCKTLYELNNFASMWACIENILLAMAAEGLFGVTYVPRETAALKKMLNLPEDYEVAALIPIGYSKPYEVKQKPVPLCGKIHENKW
jgi:5,6-dimethylbenzimidazole synthase